MLGKTLSSRSLSSSINRFLTQYPVVLSLMHRFLVSHRKKIQTQYSCNGSPPRNQIYLAIYLKDFQFTLYDKITFNKIGLFTNDWFDLKILSGASKSWTNRKIINPVGSLRDIIQSHNGGLLSQYCRFSHFQRSLMLSCKHATGERSNMFFSSNQAAVFPLQI